jgi:hypothetical protein
VRITKKSRKSTKGRAASKVDEEIKNLLKTTITADMVRPKKGRRGNKQNPGRKIRNPELEAFALNFVKDVITNTGNYSCIQSDVKASS